MGAANWFKHAFALDPSAPIAPTDAQREIVERLAHEVVRRHLTTPASLALEVCSPLNFVSGQAMQFFQPLLSVFADARTFEEFATFIEQRGAVDYMRERIETVERAYSEREHTRIP